jgi:hypothetical protein
LRLEPIAPPHLRCRPWDDEIRDIRDSITGEEPKRILAEITADFDRLHD